jgi:uncharacterized protein
MRLAEKVMPFYFGSPDKLLFGCYHEPTSERRRNCAVVVCQPVGHEYINSHRALRQLAARLCDAGFPVLRFDYYGCGDSSGSREDGTILQWLEDISNAISEARSRTAVAQVCLIGLRLGGTLAMIAAAERADLGSVVLWDPVVSGKGYLDGLLRLQKEMLRFRPKPGTAQEPQGYLDVLGFPLSRFLRAELEKIELLPIMGSPAKNVLVIQSDQMSSEANLEKHFCKAEARLVEYQRFDAPQIWRPTSDGSLLVPSQILHSIVSWTHRVHP